VGRIGDPREERVTAKERGWRNRHSMANFLQRDVPRDLFGVPVRRDPARYWHHCCAGERAGAARDFCLARATRELPVVSGPCRWWTTHSKELMPRL
jgi:hypothetical protein